MALERRGKRTFKQFAKLLTDLDSLFIVEAGQTLTLDMHFLNLEQEWQSDCKFDLEEDSRK